MAPAPSFVTGAALEIMFASKLARAWTNPGTGEPDGFVASLHDISTRRLSVSIADLLAKPINWNILIERLTALATTLSSAQPGIQPNRSDLAGAPLDIARNELLRDSLGAARVRLLLDLLVMEFNRCPKRIRQCIERGDLDAARAEAHSLRGAADRLGATALGRVARAIKSGCAAGSPELDALDAQARRTVRAIAALR